MAYYLVAAGYNNAEGKQLADKLRAELTPRQVSGAQDEAKRLAVASKRPVSLVRK